MIVEDLSAFFPDWSQEVATDDGATFSAILESDYVSVGDVPGVDSVAYSLICKTADVTDIGQGAILTIDATQYVVRSIQPDGTGVTVLRIETTE